MNNTVQTLAQTQILADFDDQNPVMETTHIIDAEYTITSEDIPHELSASKELVAINDNKTQAIISSMDSDFYEEEEDYEL